MKRLASIFLSCLLLISITLAGCNSASNIPNNPDITPSKVADIPPTEAADITPTKPAEDTNKNVSAITEAPRDNVINVFSMTDEIPRMIMKYKELRPDFPYEIKMFTFATVDADFHTILDEFLADGGIYTPDIYTVESANVMKYSQDDAAKYALPYKELGIDVDNLVKEADIAQYVIDLGKNPEGEIVALTHQGTGGAYIYRRSIAKAVWGTDEPEVIKDKVGPGWEKFFEAAADLKAKGYGIVSGEGDIWHSIENSAEMPWVVNGKLYIDPKREAFLDLAKQLKDKGYSNDTQDWTEDWYADIKGTGKKQIFGFFGPSWFVNYVMKNNCGGEKIGEGTYGDWAVCEPPVGFFWGGSWIYVNKNSKHKEAIGDIIKWLTLDSSETGLQHYWANGIWNGDGGVLEAVASGTVMKNSIGELDFLGNQNMFDVFDKAAKLANGNNQTQYDSYIYTYWRDQVREYTAGTKTREQAIADFKQKVKENLDIVSMVP